MEVSELLLGRFGISRYGSKTTKRTLVSPKIRDTQILRMVGIAD